MTKNKGITLIALIITIIIMLILVGVVLAVTFGENGLISKAKQAALAYENSTIEEANIADIYGYNIEYVLDGGINPEGTVTSYKEGEVITFPTPTKENYIFEGWYQTEDFTGSKMIATTTTTKENLKLYARWVQPTSETYFSWTTSGTNATITGLSAAGLAEYNAGNLTEIVFPKTYSSGQYTVKTINGAILSGKVKIERIFIPANISSIVKNAFSNCGQTAGELKVTLEEGRTSLSLEFLQGANYLKTIVIPEGVKSLGGRKLLSQGAFYGCTRLTDITIPSTLTSIGECAFYNCTGITSVTLPSSLTAIGAAAFANCTGITSVTLPQTDINIVLGEEVFKGCTKLESITIPANIYIIGKNSFYNCGSTAGEFKVTLEPGRTNIPRGFLQGANYLKTIVIPEGVESLEGRALYSESVFYGCTKLINVTIPSTVTTIGEYLFKGCTSLTNLVYQDTTEKWSAITKGTDWKYGVPATSVTCTNGTIAI